MAENADNNDATKTAGDKENFLANYLASALDMEDEVNISVYNDYMNAKNWPKNIKPEVFQSIKQHLTTLIEDTRKHKQIILGLMQQYGQNK